MLAAAYHVAALRHGLRPESGTSVYAGAENIDALEHERGTGGSGPVHTLRLGTNRFCSRGRHRRCAHLTFTPTRLSAAVLRDEIAQALASVHLTPVSITFDHVDGYPAPVVVASAPYPGIVIRHLPQWRDAVGRDSSGFEGIYLQLDYTNGRPAIAIGVSSRTTEGLSWTKPRLKPDPGDT